MLRRGSVYRLKKNDEMGVKPRPVVVISRNEINSGHSVTIVPFYSQQFEERSELDYCVPFYRGEFGLDRNCVAKADEVSRILIATIDLRSRIGEMSEQRLQSILEAVQWCLITS